MIYFRQRALGVLQVDANFNVSLLRYACTHSSSHCASIPSLSRRSFPFSLPTSFSPPFTPTPATSDLSLYPSLSFSLFPFPPVFLFPCLCHSVSPPLTVCLSISLFIHSPPPHPLHLSTLSPSLSPPSTPCLILLISPSLSASLSLCLSLSLSLLSLGICLTSYSLFPVLFLSVPLPPPSHTHSETKCTQR